MAAIKINPIAAEDIAHLLQLSYMGPKDLLIDSISASTEACPNALTFVTSSLQIGHDCNTRLVITSQAVANKLVESHTLISKSPRYDFAKIISQLQIQQPPLSKMGIDESVHVHPRAVIDEKVFIAQDVQIDPGAVIGPGVSIGARSHIGANAVIEAHTIIGQDCVIGPGTIIGSQGFGYEMGPDGKWLHIPHLGAVHIGDHVEIGANVTIDRGMLQNTVIEDGVCLDNIIQVAHNVRIGAHSILAAHTAIGGSTSIGRYCMIGGGCLIKDHVNIADQSVITGGSNVATSIKSPGIYSSGMSITDNKTWRRNHRRMLNLHEHLKDLENGN